jgi:hypothetical protein
VAAPGVSEDRKAVLLLIQPVLADLSRAVLPRVQKTRPASSVSVRLAVAVVEVVGEPGPVDSSAPVDSPPVAGCAAAESVSGQRALAEEWPAVEAASWRGVVAKAAWQPEV